jgi:hypothetical protein
MELVADAVRAGECVLFLGSAVHAPPPQGAERSENAYPPEHRPAMAGALVKRLAERSGWPQRFGRSATGNPVEPWDLQRMSLYFEVVRSRDQLVDEITRAVHTDKKPSPILTALAELSFPVIITTNYDRLFDRALEQAGKEPHVHIYNPEGRMADDRRQPTVKEPFLLKMHGDVRNPESIVITDEDYIQFVLVMSRNGPLPVTYAYHLQKWPTLFVGYSLLDYNLRLLFKMLRWGLDLSRIPVTYSVDREPDPLILDVWQDQRRYVKFIAQDVWSFVPDLYERVTGRGVPT